MIVIGYQGIGKSTLANKCLKFVDLESGNFWIDGVRSEDWYKPYCKIAEHLSEQGYTVFTSSHEVVRKQLRTSTEKVICCVPDPSLKDKWVAKLKDRYEYTSLDKDYEAWKNAEDRYTENIEEISSDIFGVIHIRNMNYELESLICAVESLMDK